MGDRLISVFFTLAVALLAPLPIGLVAVAWLGQPAQEWQAFAGVSASAWTVVIVVKSCDWSMRGARIAAYLLLGVPLLLSGVSLPAALLGWLALVVLFWMAQCALGERHIIEGILIVAIIAAFLTIVMPAFARAKARAGLAAARQSVLVQPR